MGFLDGWQLVGNNSIKIQLFVNLYHLIMKINLLMNAFWLLY